MNNTINNRLTKLLIKMSQNSNRLFAVLIMSHCFFLLYDILVYKNKVSFTFLEYLKIVCVCLFAWFGVKLVFWVQIKNPWYSEKFFNVASIIILIGSLIVSIISAVNYILIGFDDSVFVFLTISVCVVRVQKLRKENKL